MIKNFKSKSAQDVYDAINSKDARKIPKELHDKVRRLFDQINAVPSITTLRKPPGNKLEKLSGKLKDLWSLRVNDQWRIVFRWQENNALDVDVVDYH